MATIFSHAVAAVAVGKVCYRAPRPWRFWFATAACACLPDIDVAGMRLGVPYESLLGHRGLTHSLLFAAVTGLAAAWLVTCGAARPRRFAATAIFLFVVTASHGVLDAMTDGGHGIAFFAPFDAKRYFLPWRPIRVSPIGMRFFSMRGWETLKSELAWVWLPSGAVICMSAGVRWRQACRASGNPR